MTQKLLLDKGSYSFGLLDSLRKNTAYYVKNYESNTALEDKFREVFMVYELLTKYPSTKEEFDKIEITKKEIEEKAKAEKKLADSVRWVTTLSQLFFVDGWKLGQSLEIAKKNNPAYFLKTKAETSKSFPNLRIITSEAQPKFAVYVNANNKIVGFRKITETKKKFNVYSAEYDFNTQSKFYKNQYNNVFGLEALPVIKNKKEGKYEWTKDGKTVIVSWFRHESFLDYTEFFEDLIDKLIQ
ncbi:MAG: hypothetical protein K2X37_02235 [Chitinophagaceae bacterium]|nr:hypothetical protein [Chitinophagaceae bacterium]